jgi:NAD(P)-dependent dehydrogenase (short-subunit alcohol dehydrogenase family)
VNEADTPTDVVIGAGSGIGRAVAEALHGERPLIVADRNLDAVSELARRLGPPVTAASVDITDEAQVRQLALPVKRLGALVITAGLSPHMASGRPIYEVNLIGTARVLRAFASAIVPGSAAVCFASMAGHLTVPARPVMTQLERPLDDDLLGRLTSVGIDVDEPNTAYVLSKAGVIRLARNLAAEWGLSGGRIVSLSPGIIDTPMGQLAIDDELSARAFIDPAPIPRLGRPEEIASVAAFLCSAGASYVTGIDILADGGATYASMPPPDADGQ